MWRHLPPRNCCELKLKSHSSGFENSTSPHNHATQNDDLERNAALGETGCFTFPPSFIVLLPSPTLLPSLSDSAD
ncbi:hypothetical protein E2C01_086953 [Portunus trituberculatus]|uniref:Uncharacterized protein n=1 Tax=Portunus trituberculatus TaxID=210409 RepID=A0A5B7J262_PORTR|nr:hypothetical protein [Portunus trituberculatus]